MATVDKKITDLATVTFLSDGDLMLLEGQNETYNVAFSTLKNDAQTNMVSNNWGSENAGKTLIVGADGRVTLGGGGGEGGVNLNNDVVFYDYDGSMVATYSASDFAKLSSMPANPSHYGLVGRGWNWSLSDAKAHVAKYGKLNIGQMYITDDGKTRIYIHLEEGRTSPMLGVCPNGTADVDWGDGTAHDTLTGTSTSTVKWTPTHNYTAPGDYVIKLTINGSVGILGYPSNDEGTYLLRYSISSNYINNVYTNSIKHIEIGNNVTILYQQAFGMCRSLRTITIPDTITYIGTGVFNYCYSLNSVTIPIGITTIEDYLFGECYSLNNVTIPNGITSIYDYAFYNCRIVDSITIPDTVTTIFSNAFCYCNALKNVFTIPTHVTSINSYTFCNCYSLSGIIIPDGVTSINKSSFSGCRSLKSIIMPNSITSIGNDAFYDCSALKNIRISNSVTTISDYAFQLCKSLEEVLIPDSVTSIGRSVFSECNVLRNITLSDNLTSIGQSAFLKCCSLAIINLPNSVESIGNTAFKDCFGVAEIHFNSLTPPTVGNEAFTGIPTDCIIYVPTGTLSAYTSAANYPDPNTYTYVEE